MTEEYLITLAVPPALEESLVDWLLSLETPIGFTSYTTYGHSSRTEGLTLAEQVAGRKKQMHFQMHMPASWVSELIVQLHQDFEGTGIHYWVTPVLKSGHI
jgi:hypothetical protein